MGRHTIINPKTNRAVYKTGRLGKEIQKKMKKQASTTTTSAKKKVAASAKKASTVAKKKKTMTCRNGVCVPKPCYAKRNSTKRPSPAIKSSASGGARLSARHCFDHGGIPYRSMTFYNGRYHLLALRPNSGSPFWKLV